LSDDCARAKRPVFYPLPRISIMDYCLFFIHNMFVSPQDHKNAKQLFILSLILAALAIFIGSVFYSTDDGGPARFIGLAAFAIFIISLIFRQRARQVKQHRPATSLGTYGRNVIVAIVLLPLYLLGSYLSLIFGWASDSYLPAIAILMGLAGLIFLILSKYKYALICFSFFVIPLIIWAFGQ
jgi:hypothetical protein